MSRRVLVTGGCGYAGTVLCGRLLDRGYKVRCFDNGQRNSCDTAMNYVTNDNFEFVYGNINSMADLQKAFKDVDICVHLAANVGLPITTKFTEYSNLVNIDGTKNVIKARPSKDIPLLFASTGSIYGALTEICTETSSVNPLSPYGVQKKLAEQAVMEAGNSTAFRFATAYGPSPNFRADLLINELTLQAVKQRCIAIFQADFARTFIYITDFCDAFIYAMHENNWSKFNGEVFNAGTEANNWTKRDVAEYLKNVTGCSVFYADEGYVDIDARNYVVSYEKLHKTGFRCQIPMNVGISNLIKSIPILGLGNSRYQDKLL